MKVFVDTSALFALVDEDDPMHRAAVQTLADLRGFAQLVTHNYVVIETTTLVRRRLGRNAEEHLLDALLPIVDTIWVDDGLHRASVAAYRAAGRPGSIVDHTCFEFMRAEGITYAWAYDLDFEREGFGLPPRASGTTDAPRRLSEPRAHYGPSLAGEDDLVGVAEIATRSGHPTSTVQSWRRRHASFPTPFANLASGPVWRWPSIERWIRGEPRRPGRWAGKLQVSDDFDAPLPDFAAYEQGSPRS